MVEVTESGCDGGGRRRQKTGLRRRRKKGKKNIYTYARRGLFARVDEKERIKRREVRNKGSNIKKS